MRASCSMGRSASAIEARGQRQDYRGHAPLSQSRNVGVTHENRRTFPLGSRCLRACREGVSRTPPFSTSVLDKLDLRSNPTGEMKGTPLPALTVTPAPEPGSRFCFSQRGSRPAEPEQSCSNLRSKQRLEANRAFPIPYSRAQGTGSASSARSPTCSRDRARRDHRYRGSARPRRRRNR